MGNDGTPATVAREGEAITVERDEARARTASDTEVLTELLASPWEQVRAAAALNPAAPAGAASGSYTPTSGPTLLSALALSPGLSQDDRNEIYLRVAEREDRDRNDGAGIDVLALARREDGGDRTEVRIGGRLGGAFAFDFAPGHVGRGTESLCQHRCPPAPPTLVGTGVRSDHNLHAGRPPGAESRNTLDSRSRCRSCYRDTDDGGSRERRAGRSVALKRHGLLDADDATGQ